MNNLIPLILITFGGLILTIGDIFMQKWVNTERYLFFFFGMVIYLGALTLLTFSFRYKNIVIASVMYILVNVISLLLINHFYFNQTLTINQYVAIFFGLLCFIFLEIS